VILTVGTINPIKSMAVSIAQTKTLGSIRASYLSHQVAVGDDGRFVISITALKDPGN